MDRAIVENICYMVWDISFSAETRPFFPNTTYSAAIQYSSFVLSVVTCIIGLAANIVVIFATGFLMKKNKYKIWFLNLALADFTFLLFLPLLAVSLIRGSWPYGSSMCKLYNFLTFVNMYASIYILIVLNIDRAVSVAKPIWHRRFHSRRFCRCMCAVIWISSATCSIPAITYSDVNEIYGRKQCFLSFTDFSAELSADHDYETFARSLNKFPRELCQFLYDNLATSERMLLVATWKKVFFEMVNLFVPPVVFGYCIPLGVILISNVAIAYHVKNSMMAASSRLYRVVILSVLSFICIRTPLICSQVTLLVCMSTMQLHVVYNICVVGPLLYCISATNSLLNPVVYVLIGKQVKAEILGYLRKFE